MDNPETKQPPDADDTVSVLSALLDFYSDRATGFASLFVASIFGLVTLSAIIQNYSVGNPYWYVVAGVPYFAFVISGYYTWDRFRYWADIAHSIESYGLRVPHIDKLKKILCSEKIKGKKMDINLYDYILTKHKEQKTGFTIKRLLSGNHSFTILYLITVIFLTVIAYWDFLTGFLIAICS